MVGCLFGIDVDVDRVLVFAIGGGGDVASAVVLAEALRRCGVRAFVAALAWERLVYDPEPGPLPLDCVSPRVSTGACSMLVLPGCTALRGGRVFVPNVCRAASFLGEPVGVVDAYGGAAGVARGLDELLHLLSCDAVLAVDVGGDVLARGGEETLWSPLADALGLAGTVLCSARVKLLAVHSPGADGELPMEYVLSRVSEVAADGGYLGAFGVGEPLRGVMEGVLSVVNSEASRVQLEALRGLNGVHEIRSGTRVVRVSIVSTVSFIMDAVKAFEHAPLARAVAGSTSLEEARRRLNEAGVMTEFDLEELAHYALSRGFDVASAIRWARRVWREGW